MPPWSLQNSKNWIIFSHVTIWVKIEELDFFDRTVRKVRNWNRKWVPIDGTPCMYAKNFGLLDFQTFLVLGPLQNYYSHLVFAVMYHYKVITLHFRVIVTEWYILACKVKTRLMMVNCLLCRQTWCQNFLQSPLRCLATDLWIYGRRSMIWNYNWMVRNS